MLRRFFSSSEAVQPDPVAASARLLELPGTRERCAHVLAHLAGSLGSTPTAGSSGNVRGYVVLGTNIDTYRFEAAQGYAPDLLTLTPAHGPWRDPGPRVVNNLVAELFTPNTKEMRTLLGGFGLREAKATLIVPVTGDERHGALVLHRHGPEGFNEADLREAAGWGRLLGGVESLHGDLYRTRQSLIEFTNAFVEAMEAEDFSQLGHAKRVTAYALAIGRALDFNRQSLADLYFAAILHDVGKLGAGDKFGGGGDPFKSGVSTGASKDTSSEDEVHPQRGANLIASSPLLSRAARGIRAHHERWDGAGFPQELRGEAIPLLGRIVAVADTFDLLSSERGRALPPREVERELLARAGSSLDPNLVGLFINILRKGKSTAELGTLEHSDLPF